MQKKIKINAQTETTIQAFTLASLSKLAMTKSVDDKNVTLLDFLAKTLEAHLPDAVRVLDDLPTLSQARKVELQAQMRLIRDSRRAVEGLRKVKQLEVFAFTAMQSLDSVESQMGVARDFFDRACAYFAIEVGAMDSHEFFENLYVFLDALSVIAEKARKVAAASAKKDKEAQKKQEAQEKAEIDAQLGAVPRKARQSILKKMSTAITGGPPRPPVPVFTKKPKD